MIKRISILFFFFASVLAFANSENPSVEPEKALGWLTNGNKRFVTSTVRKDGQGKADVHRLSSGQHPHAIVLSCSDSRVPPEIVFDQKLGELFTVRTAGESLGDNAIGSIEYAVEHLGAQLILVMGHTACGAVKAAHGTLDGKSAGTPALDHLVQDIHPRISAFKGKTPTANFEKESWANAEGVAHDLVSKSALLRERWEKGLVWIVPSLYDLGSGKVAFGNRMLFEAERKAASDH